VHIEAAAVTQQALQSLYTMQHHIKHLLVPSIPPLPLHNFERITEVSHSRLTRDAVSQLRFFVDITTNLPERSIARNRDVAKHVLQSCRVNSQELFPSDFGAAAPQIMIRLFKTVLLDVLAVNCGCLIQANALLNIVAMELKHNTQRSKPLQFKAPSDIVSHARYVCIPVPTKTQPPPAPPHTPHPATLSCSSVQRHVSLITRGMRAVEWLVVIGLVKINTRSKNTSGGQHKDQGA